MATKYLKDRRKQQELKSEEQKQSDKNNWFTLEWLWSLVWVSILIYILIKANRSEVWHNMTSNTVMVTIFIIWVVLLILAGIFALISKLIISISESNRRRKIRRWYNSLTDKEKEAAKDSFMKDDIRDAFFH